MKFVFYNKKAGQMLIENIKWYQMWIVLYAKLIPYIYCQRDER